jgi:hypothetical protein
LFYFEQQLSWVTAGGEMWLREHRRITLTIDADSRAMLWQMRFQHASIKALELGSAATEGRRGAGYGGLFWRGTRGFRTALATDSSANGIKRPRADYNGSDVS